MARFYEDSEPLMAAEGPMTEEQDAPVVECSDAMCLAWLGRGAVGLVSAMLPVEVEYQGESRVRVTGRSPLPGRGWLVWEGVVEEWNAAVMAAEL